MSAVSASTSSPRPPPSAPASTVFSTAAVSLSASIGPPGSASEMPIPATIGARFSRAHSSSVKSAFEVMWATLPVGDLAAVAAAAVLQWRRLSAALAVALVGLPGEDSAQADRERTQERQGVDDQRIHYQPASRL